MRNAGKYIYLAVFLMMLLGPLVFTNTNENVVSELDNRALAEFPEIGTKGFENEAEDYLQDRIGLRDQMVTAYQLLNDSVAGELTHPSYTYGQDGYVFFRMHNNIPYGDYHKTFAEATLKMKDYCESRGTKFYFLFDPEKISVYSRYLPTGVNYNDNWVDEMLGYMTALGVNCISNKDLLTTLSYTETVFNRQYDAGHWNDLGSYYGTNNLWNRVGKDFPSVTEYTFDDFDISTETKEFLPHSHFPVNEEVPVFTLKTHWENKSGLYANLNLDSRFPRFHYYVNKEKDTERLPKILVFHGSYYNRKPQFFIGKANEYIGIHDYQNVLNLDYYFNIFQPDLVVFEAAEYTFTDHYFDSKKMKQLDFNPAITEAVREKGDRFVFENGVSLNVIPNNGFDEVYFEREIPSARYVYLITEETWFDLQRDTHGLYSTGVPHGAIQDEVTLLYIDNDGQIHYTTILVQNE